MAIRFIPTEEQVMLRASVRRWAQGQDPLKPAATDAVWSHAAEMGWLMAGLPQDVGGLGGDAYDVAIIAEELGRALVRAPFVEVVGPAAQVLLALAPERIEALVSGDSRPVLAHDEAAARGDPDWVRTEAARGDNGAWRLSGRKTGVIGGPEADVLLVSAIAEGSPPSLFAVPAGAARLRAFDTIDGRAGAELLLDATPAALVGGLGYAGAALNAAHDHALVLESAEALGAMQRAFDLTRDYLLTRRQYGQLIGEFQALRHRLADMFVELEQARSMVLRGVEALVASPPAERARLAAATKARVAQAGGFVTAQAIQLHGGIGVTQEYPVGHYFKRLLAFEQRHGSAAAQVERFAALSG